MTPLYQWTLAWAKLYKGEMNMKKVFALLLACVLTLSLAACGGDTGAAAPPDASANTPDRSQSEPQQPAEAPLDYPKSNITCIIPYGAGGTMDTLSRALFESIPDGLVPSGVNFVVENVAGGGGLVGTEQGLTRKADGYTIVGVNGDLIINHAIGATEIVLEEDFVPIVCLQDEPYCLIGPGEGECSTLEGFINKLKSGDNGVTVAITGAGSPGGLATRALSESFGVEIKTVTFDANNDCALSVTTGECDATFINVSGVAGQVEAGTLKVLAVTTAEEAPSLPGIPSIAQTYPECGDLNLRSVCFLGALADTDPAIIQWLSDTLNQGVASQSYADLTAPQMMIPKVWDIDGMTQYCKEAYAFYVSLLEE